MHCAWKHNFCRNKSNNLYLFSVSSLCRSNHMNRGIKMLSCSKNALKNLNKDIRDISLLKLKR